MEKLICTFAQSKPEIVIFLAETQKNPGQIQG